MVHRTNMAKGKKKNKKSKVQAVRILPLLGLASGGFLAPPGWNPPLSAAMQGDWKAAGESVMANYMFYDAGGQRIAPEKGIAVKLTFLGGLISMVTSWLGFNRKIHPKIPIKL